MKRTLAILAAAAALLLGAAGVAGAARAATTPRPVATQAHPDHGPGWGMMGGYATAGAPASGSQAWQEMWAACDRFMGSWGQTAPSGGQ